MRYTFYIILSLIVVTSCTLHTDEELNGIWTIDMSEESQYPFFPINLNFKEDSVLIKDQFCFEQAIKYQINDTLLTFQFIDSTKQSYNISIQSDSIIYIDSIKYIKSQKSNFLNQPMNLLGEKTSKLWNGNTNSPILHLIKYQNKAKVILNNTVSELHDIPSFLSNEKDSTIIIYLGKDISLLDLSCAYIWINMSKPHHTKLITANIGIEKFYMCNDVVCIDSSLKQRLMTNNNIPPSPNQVILPEKTIHIINANDISKLDSIDESINYTLKISHQIDINDYIKLTQITNDKQNIVKILSN